MFSTIGIITFEIYRYHINNILMHSHYNEVTILTVWYFSETVALGYVGQYKIVLLNSNESYDGISFFLFSFNSLDYFKKLSVEF